MQGAAPEWAMQGETRPAPILRLYSRAPRGLRYTDDRSRLLTFTRSDC